VPKAWARISLGCRAVGNFLLYVVYEKRPCHP
jgi:hypothetical protein